MDIAATLSELSRQIRTETIHLLTQVPPDWLLFSPEGIHNHLLWHAGHALWLQDVLCIQPLTGQSELPAHWAGQFGMNSHPAHFSNWPPREDVAARLQRQLQRMLELFPQHAERLSRQETPPGRGWGLLPGILHGLHDEARHQGQMSLLCKLRRMVRTTA